MKQFAVWCTSVRFGTGGFGDNAVCEGLCAASRLAASRRADERLFFLFSNSSPSIPSLLLLVIIYYYLLLSFILVYCFIILLFWLSHWIDLESICCHAGIVTMGTALPMPVELVLYVLSLFFLIDNVSHLNHTG